MVTEPILSTTNTRIKSLVRLRTRRERDTTGSFIIEGYRELRRAVGAGLEFESVYFCPDLFIGGNEQELVEACRRAGARAFEVAEAPFRKASYRDRPEGLLGVARQFATGLDRLPLEGNPLLLVAESIEKPGNLGTMLRTAEGAALSGVVVADPTTDPFNPNVVRASIGTVFDVPLAVTDSTTAIDRLRGAGVRIVATTPDATLPHYEADLTGPVALVIGSEQYGLSDEWLQRSDVEVRIPMPGSVDSLNAAMSAGIVIFEALRQRA